MHTVPPGGSPGNSTTPARIQGVTVAQLESLAARAPVRALPASSAPSSSPPAGNYKPGDVEARARAYLATIPPAVSGQHGHDRTFYAAGRLVRGFDLSPAAALPLLAEWNARCEPPWSERELSRKLEQQANQPGARGFLLGSAGSPPPATSEGGRPFTRFRNHTLDEVKDGESMRQVKRGRPLEAIAEELYHWTFGYPKRCGGELFAVDSKTHQPIYLKTDAALFAWIGARLASRCDGADPIQWDGRAGPSKAEFRAYLEQTAESYEAIELFPHEPPLPGHFYVHPELPEGDGAALREFVRMFAPATGEDEDLIRAFVATLFWGGPAGQSPLFVILPEPNDPEAGRGVAKTSVAQHVMGIVGGAITLRSSEKFGDFVKRLINNPTNNRCILLDNMKCDGKFGWADLESLLTASSISGSKHYVGEGQRPNHFTFAMTTNETDFTDDIAKRAIPIWLTRPGHQSRWERTIREFVDLNRWKLAADCIALLRGEAHGPALAQRLRWSAWEEEVLCRVSGNPVHTSDLIRTLIDRQDEMNAGKDERKELPELIRAEIVAAVKKQFPTENPETLAVRIPSARMAVIYSVVAGRRIAPYHVTRALKKVTVEGLGYNRVGNGRQRAGWDWRGSRAASQLDDDTDMPTLE